MSKLYPRPPVIVILGHVDHGKTTLLDYIRSSKLATKEVGGITQRIGAYEILTGIKGYPTDKITFIDTPGHEAFSHLRARGAHVADLAVLIVDAKDSVMPQTIESISHIKSSDIPFIVAINKIDLPEANIDRVKSDLAKQQVFTEDRGGNIIIVPISAKTGKGVHDLLEAILLLSSEENLKFSLDNSPLAYIIETKKDKRGIVITGIIKDGKITRGDIIYSEAKKAKVRNLINDQARVIPEVVPSNPFEMLGFEEMPEVGSTVTNQAKPKVVEPVLEKSRAIDLNMLLTEKKEEKKLKLVIKADSQGSLEAIVNTLEKKENIEIILKSIGEINKSDIFLAKAVGAIVIGYAVNLGHDVQELAKQEKVVIKTYNLIYELLDELEEVSDLILEKEEKSKSVKGEAKILAGFIIEKETVFGVKVSKGKINLDDQIELYKNNQYIGKTKLVSLRIRAKNVSEVKKDEEAGMLFYPLLDMKVGDVLKSIS